MTDDNDFGDDVNPVPPSDASDGSASDYSEEDFNDVLREVGEDDSADPELSTEESSDDLDSEPLDIEDIRSMVRDIDENVDIPDINTPIDAASQQIASAMIDQEQEPVELPRLSVRGAELPPLTESTETAVFAPVRPAEENPALDEEPEEPIDAASDLDLNAAKTDAKRMKIIAALLAATVIALLVAGGLMWTNNSESNQDATSTIEDISGENADLQAKIEGVKRQAAMQKVRGDRAEKSARAESARAKAADSERDAANKQRDKAHADARKSDAEAKQAREDAKNTVNKANNAIEQANKSAVVPDVRGLTREEAQLVMEAVGFTNLSWRLSGDSGDDEAVVDDIEPGVGAYITKDAKVSLR